MNDVWMSSGAGRNKVYCSFREYLFTFHTVMCAKEYLVYLAVAHGLNQHCAIGYLPINRCVVLYKVLNVASYTDYGEASFCPFCRFD